MTAASMLAKGTQEPFPAAHFPRHGRDRGRAGDEKHQYDKERQCRGAADHLRQHCAEPFASHPVKDPEHRNGILLGHQAGDQGDYHPPVQSQGCRRSARSTGRSGPKGYSPPRCPRGRWRAPTLPRRTQNDCPGKFQEGELRSQTTLDDHFRVGFVIERQLHDERAAAPPSKRNYGRVCPQSPARGC